MALHKKFSLLYLNKFSSSFPDEETFDDWCEIWGAGLAGITAEQMKEGLRRTTLECKWAPSVSEFREFCNIGQKPVVMLPLEKKMSSEAKKSMEKIMAMLAENAKKPSKAWAHWIIEQHEAGLPVVPIALRFAREAVGETA